VTTLVFASTSHVGAAAIIEKPRGIMRTCIQCLPLTLAAAVVASCADSTAPRQPAAPATAAATDPGAAAYRTVGLTIPSAAFSGEATGINDAGFIAGWFRTSSGWTAVRWSAPSQRLALGKLSGLASALAKGINASGTIVGFAFANDFSRSRAFVWTAAAGMRALPGLGGGASLAQAINKGGTIVGWSAATDGSIRAVKWTPGGTIVDLNPPGGNSQALALNDAGDIVGWAFPSGASSSHAWLWRHDGSQLDLGTLGGPSSEARGVNGALTIVGVADRPFPQSHTAFVWTPARGMRALGMGPNSEALGISEIGRSVGLRIGSGVEGLTRFQGVTTVLPDLAPAKGPFSGPTAVNRCGTIVGSSVSPQPTNGNVVPTLWRTGTCSG
jgi:probable HAF family extracellular repeat protein